MSIKSLRRKRRKRFRSEHFVVYLVTCKTPNHFYVGYSAAVKHRWNQHTLGVGARFTRTHGVARVQIVKRFAEREAALREEQTYLEAFRARYPRAIIKGGNDTGPCECHPR